MGDHDNAVATRFETIFDGLVEHAWDRLVGRVRVAGWETLAGPLQDELRRKLTWLARPTLVLELNVARLERRLRGDTPEERFRYYVSEVLPGDWPGLLAEYGVLDDLLTETVELWIDALAELGLRLATDLPLLQGVLLPADARLSGMVTGVDSDAHRGGRIVRILEFSSPDGPARLVYKPRPMAVDVCFQALLAYCNVSNPAELRLPLLKIADRGEYGWSEFTERTDCVDIAAVERFYRRQGAYLALLHVIDGVDMHHENLIAAGENPVLVDVETLFDRHFAAEVTGDDAHAVAEARLRDSVARTLLLPGRIWGDEQHAGVNLGGLGDGQPQLMPFTSAGWEDAGTDTMHHVQQRYEIPATDNVPRLDGEAVPVATHVDALVGGFVGTLRFLVRRRTELLNGPLRAFGGVPVRQILRATSSYVHVLDVARHPDRLRSPVDREDLYDALDQATEDEPVRRVLEAERVDLRCGDVPAFTTRPDSRDLWDSRGEKYPDYFAETALARVSERLATLDEQEIAAQEFVVRASLSAASPGGGEPADPVSSALDGALAIGEMLVAHAIAGRRDVTWLGMQAIGDGTDYHLAPLDCDLYAGTPGVALFLAHLGAVSGEDLFTRFASRTAEGIRATPGAPFGGFVGLPSQLYVLTQLSALWQDPGILPPLEPVLRHIAAGVPDSEFDLVAGSAGTILSLLSLHAVTGDARALDVAADHGRHLLRHAVRDADGAAWPAFGDRLLCGFSHGCAGIGYALTALSRALGGHARFAELAEDAFRYENARFNPQTRNWPNQAGNYRPSWCNGSAGIALSRLGIDDDAAATAVQTTLDSKPRTDTLCHGELGQLLVIADAARTLGRVDWRSQVRDRLAAVLGGWRCGFTHPQSAPALMTGTSGIGYGLLRLARPDVVPQVLSLAPPTPAASSGW